MSEGEQPRFAFSKMLGACMSWLRLGATCLVVSFVAALVLPNGVTVTGNRTVFILDGWVERTSFWLGMIFMVGHVLGRIFGAERNS
jgi:hypothetical protein